MAVTQEDAKIEYAKMKDFLSFYAEQHLEIEILPPERRPMARPEPFEKKSMLGLRIRKLGCPDQVRVRQVTTAAAAPLKS
jgi:hypothetical protein